MLEFSGATRYVRSSNISLISTLTSPVLCRTYCYVRYCRREDAETATKQLNNYQIRPGTFLAVTKSVDNRRLCLKTLPSLSLEITAGEVREELRGLLEGVEGVRFLSTKWLEVEFQSHRMAALARRQLLPGNLTIFRNVNIRQVRPETSAVDHEILKY